MQAFILLVLPAMAFRPDPTIYIGSEPDRVRLYHKDVQYGLKQGAAWTDFSRGEGQGWLARFDERTGNPHRAWGPGIALGPVGDEAQVEAALRGFFARNPGLLGVDANDLVLARAGYVPQTDTWYVRFEQLVGSVQGDVPVREGAFEARIRFGKLILFGVQTYPDALAVDTTPQLSVGAARGVAIARGPAPAGAHEDLSARLVIVPIDHQGWLEHHLAWEIRTRTATPIGKWNALVDAHTGALLNVHNEIRFLSGTLEGTHDTRTVNGEYSTSPIPFVEIVGEDGSTTTTDEDGSWSLSGGSSATTSFSGEKVCVSNDGRGGDGSLTLTGDATWTEDEATLAEIDSYIFLHDVIAWREAYAPGVDVITEGRSPCGGRDILVSNVNQSSSCNAYYDGAVNFFESGGGCNNTGRIADVNYHEWGHGFHYYNAESGVYDGSISEGIGDTISAMLTGDPIIAPYFMTTGSGIREIDSDRVYPDDWVGEVHEDGLIFAGAVWDLWAELDNTYAGDADTAYDVLSGLMVNGLKGGPEIPDSYDEFVSADDDNGDLGDGTPHQCELIAAFGLHGLGPAGEGGALIELAHTPLENQAADGADFSLTAEITNIAPACADFAGGSASVFYSTDNGATWSEEPLGSDDESAWGAIPAQPEGTIVQYYIELSSAEGDTMSAPTVGRIAPYTFYVGEMVQIACYDFEDDDGGFTHELVDGRDELGADDWSWGRPRGDGGDPDYASSGTKVWGNDLGGGDYNGEYQNEKWNRLSSPSIDISGYERVVLQYRRWLGVEDGYYDQASILANGAMVWSNHASDRDVGDEHTIDDQWMLHTVEIPQDGTGAAIFSWDITSDEGLAFGGWTVDDVCVYGVAAAPVVDTGDSGDTADTGEGEGEGEPDTAGVNGDDLVLKTGCTCASAETDGKTGALALVAGIGLLAARRRRTTR